MARLGTRCKRQSALDLILSTVVWLPLFPLRVVIFQFLARQTGTHFGIECKGVSERGHSKRMTALPQDADGFQAVTGREVEILCLLSEGLSNRAIAERLFLSPATITWYTKQIYTKLGVQNRAQAIRFAQDNGFFSDREPVVPKPKLASEYTVSAQTTPFVGRVRELAELTALLAKPECRLLTLTGQGGIGKTRLALQATEALSAQTAIYFVPLQALQSAEPLLATIMAHLGVPLLDPNDLLTQLVEALQNRPVLLILDNLEHLLGGVPIIGDLLARLPKLKLLVTSRQPLRLRNEWVYPVEGLHYPTGESEDLNAFSAIQLFAATASRVRPDFSVPDEAGAVTRICRLVEGMPLALELAAGWVHTLSCADIANELEKGLGILEAQWSDVPRRHRQMRAVLEQTEALLTPDEAQTFRRLAVFAGSFTRDAAEAICGATLPVLSTLVNAALVRHDAPSGRYRMHELPRQYAEERLDDDGPVRDRHRDYFAGFVEWASTALKGSETRQTLQAMEAEIDNIRAAWDWAVMHQHANDVERFCEGLWLFYDHRYWMAEGAQAFARAVAAFDTGDARLRGKLLAYQAWFEHNLGHYERAEMLSRQSVALLREADARRELAFALDNLSSAVAFTTDRSMGQVLREESCAMFQDVGDMWEQASALRWLGLDALFSEDYEAAIRLNKQAVALFRALGNPVGLASSYGIIGCSYYTRGDYVQAKQHFEKSWIAAQQAGNYWDTMHGLVSMGAAMLQLGQDRAALSPLFEGFSMAAAVTLGYAQFACDGLIALAGFLKRHGQPAWALELLTVALAAYPDDLQMTKPLAEALRDEIRAKLPDDISAAAIQRGSVSAFRSVLQALLARWPELEALVQPTAQASNALSEALTPGELKILQLVAGGLSNQEIAHELVYSVGTVKWYVHQVFSKLGVSNRTQAAIRARELQLIS